MNAWIVIQLVCGGIVGTETGFLVNWAEMLNPISLFPLQCLGKDDSGPVCSPEAFETPATSQASAETKERAREQVHHQCQDSQGCPCSSQGW